MIIVLKDNPDQKQLENSSLLAEKHGAGHPYE